MTTNTDRPTHDRRRRWGGQRALSDDGEATHLLLEAAGRCIVEQGTASISMAKVAEEAGVTRSTLYRYFPTRTKLITALLLSRAEALVKATLASLPDPDNAAVSLPQLLLHSVNIVRGTPITNALFSPASDGLVASVELETDVLFEVTYQHFGPVLARWQDTGQIHADLDLRTTVRWMIAHGVLLVSEPWRTLSATQQRHFFDQYVGRALLRA